MPVSYLICAAGLGTRMRKISVSIPKPLIKIAGKSLLKRSIGSLSLGREDQLIILFSSSIKLNLLEQEIQSCKNVKESGCEFVFEPVFHQTQGQLETAILAEDIIPANNSICVFNADTQFLCHELKNLEKAMKWDGLIPCAQVDGDSWSFCRVKDESSDVPNIIEVAEKKRISNWCSVGYYWFKSKELFISYAKMEIASFRNKKEIFVAPLYNRLIEDNLRVGMPKVQEFKPMGSMEQVENFWQMTAEELQMENQNPN